MSKTSKAQENNLSINIIIPKKIPGIYTRQVTCKQALQAQWITLIINFTQNKKVRDDPLEKFITRTKC